MSRLPTVLFVDDEPKAGELFLRFCEASPYRCMAFQDPEKALAYFRDEGADLIITDLRMPRMSGTDLMKRIREHSDDVPVIVITAYSSVDSAIEALRLGATDFLKKPFDMDELLILVDKSLEHSRLRRENRLLRRQLRDDQERYGMVGSSPAMKEVHRIIEKIADVRCTVIIQGETGTGKELAARAIHRLSERAEQPFVVVDCGALTDTLLESELFGHEKGSFTGAAYTKRGLFEAAGRGTVFLDEIGNISEAMQIKMLRVIQEHQVTRVGGVRPIPVDVRCLAASNSDLALMVKAGTFRADLYHRLNVVKIVMPPLRERHEDIALLLRHYVDHFAQAYGRQITGFDAGSMRLLEGYHWPGNVRELRNLVERHVALAEGPVLTVDELPEDLYGGSGIDTDQPTLAELERRYVLKVLESCAGNRTRAAEVLGIDKSTLWRKLQQYGPEST